MLRRLYMLFTFDILDGLFISDVRPKSCLVQQPCLYVIIPVLLPLSAFLSHKFTDELLEFLTCNYTAVCVLLT